MAYDEELAGRVRGCLGPVEVTEKRMFGGLAFLVGGHLAVAASDRGLMVRCDPGESEALLERPGVSRMEMQGRELAGWLRVEPPDLADDDTLGSWVEVGTAYAGGLPPR